MGIEKLTELKDRMEKIKAEMVVEGKKHFHEACTEIFEANPKLESFSWEQYTPYFNDGEECIFGVRADDVNVTFEGKDLEYVSVWKGEAVGDGVEDVEDQEALTKAVEDIGKVTRFLMTNEEIAQDAFGDHCRVVVHRNGVDVEHSDHD